MDYSQIFAISASGMQVQRTRLEVAAHNLANAQTVQGPDGQPFRPLVAVARAQAAGYAGMTTSFDGVMQSESAEPGLARASAVVMEDRAAVPRMVLEPGHPYADAKGMVRYPGVNHLEQMVAITQALRIYEANLAAMQAAKTMATRALDIGGQ